MGVRACTREDFRMDEKAYDLYNSKVPNSIICPEDSSKLKFKGNLNQP